MKKTLIMLLVTILLVLTSAACNTSRTVEDGGVAPGDADDARAEASDGIPNGNATGDAGDARVGASDGLSGGVAGSTDGGDFRAASGGAGNAKAAVVDDFLGDVTAVTDGKDLPAFKGLALLRRDSLGTGSESWSSLELTEDRYVLVEENSDVQISQLADDAKNAEISLSAGKIWVIITDKLSDDETFEIKTPTCSLSVRGTVFSVSCDADGGSRVAVYEGIVQFTATDENGDEVMFDITRGIAEVIVENGTVTEIKRDSLADEELAVLRESGPTGPGRVYDVLRSLLSNIVGADAADSEDEVDELLLKQFGYTDFSYSFEWGEDSQVARYNAGAIGGCFLNFSLTGAASDVADILIANWKTGNWSGAEIQRESERYIPIWKEEVGGGRHTFDGRASVGFPIGPERLGELEEVLLFALDNNFDAVGYIIVPIQIPADIE